MFETIGEFFAEAYTGHLEFVQDYEVSLLRRWRQSRNLPRKKKKAERKKIQIEWSIMCHGKEMLLTVK